MSYFSLYFTFLFLPIVILIYNLVPRKIRRYILLIANVVFYYIISGKLIVFFVVSILSIYGGGLLLDYIDKCKEKALTAEGIDKKQIKLKYKRIQRIVLIITILFNLSFLFFFKYLTFFSINANRLLRKLRFHHRFKIIKHLAPIGISFYTLSAMSYLFDIYNGKIKADHNIIRFSLFLSFFPTIVEGPIVRYTDTAESLYAGTKPTYDGFCQGYVRILYGYFKKIIIADRLNILVKIIFNNYLQYSGLSIVGGIISYTILLYMEFSGTMDVVIGAASIFGVKVPENFKQPFFAKTIQEFWMRWHISLGLWFKDYIFYPVSLSKPIKKLTSKSRKVFGNHYGALITGLIALFMVWSLNGLWHGAGYTFLFYGMYHFVLISLGSLFQPLIIKICTKLKINRENWLYKTLQNIKLIILVLIGEMFFRAPTVTAGFQMLKRIFTNFLTFKSKEFFSLGLDIKDYIIVLIALIVVLVISILKEKGYEVRELIKKQNIFVRWSIYYLLILAIIIFGAYGPGYVPVDPIYADF